MARVLIGCECSGVVRRAFCEAGHDAWSCDTQPADDNSPFHFQSDLLAILEGRMSPTCLTTPWDLLIAHPPCTYLSSSGLHWNNKTPGRAEKTEAGLMFVRALLACNVPRVAVENPTGCIGSRIRPADQYVQPYEFGDDASKKTGLWLKNLPLLVGTERVPGRMVEWPKGSGIMVERWSNQTDSGQNRLGPSPTRAKQRSQTYPGLARAMADTWGPLL